ncbi:copper chaperone [Hyunsoonleella flava]|uniref:Copper chaperone n=1 Tax=Hyunsoonleella flava TaxID=2527939 RepID=A0A4Q9FA95_9FLAO|nr:heavy-metal-associated domain-containing protein [Hyunsoonleella flava]TBN00420.1 copper chaperone [Hyunsoonleella flava]
MKTTLKIQNLKCGGCANTILKKMSTIKNITDIEVDNETDTVSFNYDDNNTLNKVTTLLNNIGYPVNGEKNALSTKAKSFVSCAVGRIKS